MKSMILAVAALLTLTACPAPDLPQATVGADGTVQVPAMAIPLSSYMSEEAKRAYANRNGAFDSDALKTLDSRIQS